jgi:hypothetical protein
MIPTTSLQVKMHEQAGLNGKKKKKASHLQAEKASLFIICALRS